MVFQKKKTKELLKMNLKKKVYLILPSKVCCGFEVRLPIFCGIWRSNIAYLGGLVKPGTAML